MSTHWPKPGVNHVGEYQASGHTLVVTGSANTIFLKYVASSITVTNISDYIDGAGNNKSLIIYDSKGDGEDFTLRPGSTATFKGKFLTFKVPSGMSALVSVTNIPSGSYHPPSGSQLHHI